MMNFEPRSLCYAAAATLAGIVFFLFITDTSLRQASAAVPAYTIYQHMAIKADTPNPTTTENRIVAQRGDGSHANVKHHPSTKFDTREIVSVGEGTQRTVFDDARVVSTFKVDISTYMKTWGTPRSSATGCTKPLVGEVPDAPNKIVGMTNLQGIETNQVQIAPTFFVWLAPSMNCLEIAHEVTWASESTPSVTRLYLDKVVWGEPDPALFTVPADYNELQPSEAVRARFTHAAMAPAIIERQVVQWQRMDAKYYANRP